MVGKHKENNSGYQGGVLLMTLIVWTVKIILSSDEILTLPNKIFPITKGFMWARSSMVLVESLLKPNPLLSAFQILNSSLWISSTIYLVNSIKVKVLIYFLTFIMRGETPDEEIVRNHRNNKLWIVFYYLKLLQQKVANLVIISVGRW